MPDLSGLSRYLTAQEVRTGDLLTIANPGDIVEFDDRRNPGKKIKKLSIGLILPNGKEKILTLNDTSRRTLEKEWGMNSDTWVGKTASVSVGKQNVGGTMKDVIYMFPAEKGMNEPSIQLGKETPAPRTPTDEAF